MLLKNNSRTLTANSAPHRTMTYNDITTALQYTSADNVEIYQSIADRHGMQAAGAVALLAQLSRLIVAASMLPQLARVRDEADTDAARDAGREVLLDAIATAHVAALLPWQDHPEYDAICAFAESCTRRAVDEITALLTRDLPRPQ
jgi:hypothetical protein